MILEDHASYTWMELINIDSFAYGVAGIKDECFEADYHTSGIERLIED